MKSESQNGQKYIFNMFFKKNKKYIFQKALDKKDLLCYNIVVSEKSADDLGVAQLVARYLGVVEAASSSLVTQTKRRFFGISVFLCFFGRFPVFWCFQTVNDASKTR